jgi:hypothetical protein
MTRPIKEDYFRPKCATCGDREWRDKYRVDAQGDPILLCLPCASELETKTIPIVADDLESSFLVDCRISSMEGRLDPTLAASLGLETGTVRCLICGMLNHAEEEALECCRGLEIITRPRPQDLNADGNHYCSTWNNPDPAGLVKS